MILGITFLLLTGLCWVGIALVSSMAAKHAWDMDMIQVISSCVIGATALGVMAFQTPLTGTLHDQLLVACPVFLAGCCNFLMLKWIKCGMQSGNNVAVWGITQSAMLCPFLMGILCFNVEPTFFRLLGIITILNGIMLFTLNKPMKSHTGYGWLLPTLGAFTASGAAQCLANLPSYLTAVHMSSACRACLVQVGCIGAYMTINHGSMHKSNLRNIIAPILVLSSVQILSLFFFFYRGLNLVAEAGCGSIGYPIAQGSSIVLFMVYSRIFTGEHHQILTYVALLSIVFGIFFISL